MTNVDFHCHSTASDGALTPAALAARAIECELDYFAITDHDTLDGFNALVAKDWPFHLVSGVELSVQHGAQGLHMVALNFAADAPQMQELLAAQLQRRLDRAQVIAQKLERAQFVGVVDFVANLGQRPVSRPELANYLVDSGQIKSVKKAFDRFLGKGKVGDVKQHWVDMDEAIRCVKACGGVCILAHPDTYQLNRAKLKKVVADFAQLGGEALELPHQPATSDTYKFIVQLAQEFELAISQGSDFHSDNQPWRKLGHTPAMPPGLTPVWNQF